MVLPDNKSNNNKTIYIYFPFDKVRLFPSFGKANKITGPEASKVQCCQVDPDAWIVTQCCQLFK